MHFNIWLFKSLLFIRQSYLIMQGTAESAWRFIGEYSLIYIAHSEYSKESLIYIDTNTRIHGSLCNYNAFSNPLAT